MLSCSNLISLWLNKLVKNCEPNRFSHHHFSLDSLKKSLWQFVICSNFKWPESCQERRASTSLPKAASRSQNETGLKTETDCQRDSAPNFTSLGAALSSISPKGSSPTPQLNLSKMHAEQRKRGCCCSKAQAAAALIEMGFAGLGFGFFFTFRTFSSLD